MTVLIAFGGLPGTGKSTIARALSARTGAVFLRIDEIETALREHDPTRELGPEGYDVAAALAASNLAIGHDAIVDCVNPWPLTREIFMAAALRGGGRLRCKTTIVERCSTAFFRFSAPRLEPASWQRAVARARGSAMVEILPSAGVAVGRSRNSGFSGSSGDSCRVIFSRGET